MKIVELLASRFDDKPRQVPCLLFGAQEVNRVMRGMEDGPIGRDYEGSGADGRRMRALAKRCIALTEENKVIKEDCPCNHAGCLRVRTYT